MASYKAVKSVEKAFVVLELLNRQPITRLRDLAEGTGLPRSTLVRALETLIQLGYVRQVDRLSGYVVTDKVLSLSAGHHGLPAALEKLAARADALTHEWLWPASIATLDGDAMVVRYSTIPASPLAHIHSTINRRLSLARRAHGRAYLAFCPEEERDYLLGVIAGLPSTAPDFSRPALESLLEGIRSTGFARRAPELGPQTSTLAVPVWAQGRLVATLGMTFFARSIPDPAPLIQALKSAARSLETLDD
jgi:IclR family mhp operon transcriptional activator